MTEEILSLREEFKWAKYRGDKDSARGKFPAPKNSAQQKFSTAKFKQGEISGGEITSVEIICQYVLFT